MAQSFRALAALALLPLAVGCGGPDSPTSPTSPPAAATPSPAPPAPAPAPPAPAGAPPAITALSLHGAPPAGGALLLVVGTGFQPGVAVTLGGAAAGSVALDPAAGGLTCLTPALAAGFYDLVVRNPDGQSATSPGFHVGPPPVPSSFSPATVVRGDAITIDGAGFSAAEGVQVMVGGTIAAIVSKSATQLVVTAPKLNPGMYQLSVVNFDGQYGLPPGTIAYPGP